MDDAKTTVVPVKHCNAKPLREGGLLASNDPKVPELPSENDKKKLTQEDSNKAPDETENNEPDGTEIETHDPQETPEDPNEGSGSEVPQIEHDENDATEIPREETGVSDDHLVTQPEYLNTGPDEKLNGPSTENGGACPQKCPIRDVMVCARCSHGVYRTFMSACYMRMYKCHNPSEKLELVSRHACIGSAPYLGEMSRPSQNLVEPQDKDPVMDYIFGSRNSGHWE